MTERPQRVKRARGLPRGLSRGSQIVLMGVLSVVLALVLLVRLGVLPIGGAKKGSPPAGKSGTATAPTKATTTKTTPTKSAATKAATSWKRPDAVGPIVRDPTRIDTSQTVKPKSMSKAASEPEHTVVGIVFNPEQPSAVIIDGQVLHEGDMISGAVVVKITPSYAELRREGKQWSVKPGDHYRDSGSVRPSN